MVHSKLLMLCNFSFHSLMSYKTLTVERIVAYEPKIKIKALLFSNDQMRIKGAQKMNLFTILVEL